MTQQTKYKLRPFLKQDAAQVVEIINAASMQAFGARQAVVDGVGNVRLTRYLPPSCEKVVVANGRDEIVAFAYCHNADQSIIFQVGGAVHPDCWGMGIGSMLVAWAEERAGAWTESAPKGVKTVLQTNLFQAEHEALKLFTRLGYQKIREWAHLVLELEAEPPIPTLADGLQIREMDIENDWEDVGPAMDAAFSNHWGTILESFEEPEELIEAETADKGPEDESYSNAPGHCFIALNGRGVIGGILCNGKWVERSDTGRVGSLFVHPDYQRQGIGRALMLTAFRAFWQAGLKRIVTDTDAHSFSETPRFYAGLGMKLYRREFLYEKEIRPGREVRRLER